MKIEKISENQIRCTLSKQDLTDRELRISELAYGTEKAKELFRDMMQQASCQFGFEAEDIPLMIEAIPVSPECLVLVITKVDDPDELDTRFSKFTAEEDSEDSTVEEEENVPYADEIIHCFDKISEILGEAGEDVNKDDSQKPADTSAFIPLPDILGRVPNKEPQEASVIHADLTKVFSFQSLEEIISLASHIMYSYHGLNHVYKNTDAGGYYLVISKTDHTPEEFNKICNIISEYGNTVRTTYASSAYFEEHFDTIVKDTAIQVLGAL